MRILICVSIYTGVLLWLAGEGQWLGGVLEDPWSPRAQPPSHSRWVLLPQLDKMLPHRNPARDLVHSTHYHFPGMCL